MLSLCTLVFLGPVLHGEAGAGCVRGEDHRDGQKGEQPPGQNPVCRVP